MKKKWVLIISAVVAFVIIVGLLVVLFIWKPFNISSNDNNQNTSNSKNETDVNTLKSQAIKAASENKITEAKNFYEEARQLYVKAGDTHAVIEIDDQLYILNHMPDQSLTSPTPTPSVGSGGSSK